jgi:hypothetical protein
VKPRWQIIHQEENSGKVSDQVTQRQKTSAKVNAAKHPQEGASRAQRSPSDVGGKVSAQAATRQSIHQKRSNDKASAEKSASSQVSAAKKQTTMATSNLQVGHTRVKKELKHM